jgi:CubicO group peptidase (beta-lactamase class C family)
MNKTVLFAIIVFQLFLQSCSNQPFRQDLEIGQSLNNLDKKIDLIVIDKMNQYNIPGLAIGLISYDSIFYTKAYGVKSIKSANPVTENSVFHAASISKLFTAVAVMNLVEQNKISLNHKLIDLIPELKYDDLRVKDITIKNLLNHTSGLTDINKYHWDNNNQSESSLEEFVLGLNLKLNSKPSSAYKYNNLAYNILGYIIEKLSATTFEDFVKEEILDNSGMYNSDFRYFKILDTLKTSPHSRNRLTKVIYQRKIYPYTREHAPSSTLNTSSADLSNWMIWFMKNINNSERKSIYSSMLEPSFDSYPYIGLGFQLYTINSKKAIGHYGGDKGYRSYLVMIPEENIGLVLLANCDYDEDFRQEILHPIAKLLLSKMSK